MKTRCRTLVIGGVLSSIGMSLLAPITPAAAGIEGRRNTAAALTGIAAYHLAKGHKGETVAAGAAALYSWQRVRDAKRKHRLEERRRRHARWLRAHRRWHRRHHRHVIIVRSHRHHVARYHR